MERSQESLMSPIRPIDWNGGLLDSESLEEVALEKRLRIQAKSPEEIAAMCIDESLLPVPRALKLLQGVDVQKHRVFADLAEVTQACPVESSRDLLPKICALAPSLPTYHVEAVTRSFQQLCANRSLPPSTFKSLCLRCILSQLKKTTQHDSSPLWFQCLLGCIPYLEESTLMLEVREIAVMNAQQTHPVAHRLESCKLIGALAKRAKPEWLRKAIIPLCKQLSQDLSSEVRVAMTHNMEDLCRGVGLQVTKSDLFQELMELVTDDSEEARLAAIETFVQLLDFFDTETCTKLLVPTLVKIFVECKSRKSPLTMVVLSQQFGKFLHLAKKYISEEGMETLIEVFCWLASQETDTMGSTPSSPRTQGSSSVLEEVLLDKMSRCRYNCTYNLPAVAQTLGRQAFSTHCLTTVRILQLDDLPVVRRTLACGLHEVVRIASPDSKPLFQVAVGLLKDDNPQVTSATLKNLPAMLKIFVKDSPDEKSIVVNVTTALVLLNTMRSSGQQWRLHEDLISSWACLPYCFPDEVVYMKFVPLLLEQLTANRVLPVKVAATHSYCHFIICARKANQRAELCEKIVQTCAKAESSRARAFFLDMCRIFLMTLSRGLFKDQFFSAILALSRDPASTVREKVCKLLPDLKAQLMLPGDRSRWQNLEKLVQDLLVVECVDSVAAEVRLACAELDRMKVRVQSSVPTGEKEIDADAADARKEAEEQSFLVVASAGNDETDGRKSVPPPAAPSSAMEGKRSKSGSGRKLSGGPRSTSSPSAGSLPISGSSSSPATTNRRTSAPVASAASSSPMSARKGGRSTSTGTVSKPGSASTISSHGNISGLARSQPSSPGGSGSASSSAINRQLSSGGGASYLAGSAGSVRPGGSSPLSRLKVADPSSRRGSSLSALDTCGRAESSKSESPSSTRHGKLPTLGMPPPRQTSRTTGSRPPKIPSPGSASAKKSTIPSLVLPPNLKSSRPPHHP